MIEKDYCYMFFQQRDTRGLASVFVTIQARESYS